MFNCPILSKIAADMSAEGAAEEAAKKVNVSAPEETETEEAPIEAATPTEGEAVKAESAAEDSSDPLDQFKEELKRIAKLDVAQIAQHMALETRYSKNGISPENVVSEIFHAGFRPHHASADNGEGDGMDPVVNRLASKFLGKHLELNHKALDLAGELRKFDQEMVGSDKAHDLSFVQKKLAGLREPFHVFVGALVSAMRAEPEFFQSLVAEL